MSKSEVSGSNLLQANLRSLEKVVRASFRASVVCLVAVAALPNVANGQSFLEKLESVVRDKLNSPPPKPQPPQASGQNVVPPPSSDVEGEELPAPRRSPANNNVPSESGSGDARMPSILEGGSSKSRGSQELELAPASRDAGEVVSNGVPKVYLGLEVEELVGGGIGVRVSKLNDNSPAWKAGFKVGDLLQAIDGHAIADLDGMADRLGRVAPGKPTKFLVKRSGRNIELTAVLQSAGLAERLGESMGPLGPAFLGVSSSDLTPAFRTQFGLAVFSGAAVTNVARESPAYAAGIRPGDAIVEINGVPIDGAEGLLRWIASAQVGQPAELMVYRGTQASMKSLVLSSAPTPADMLDRPRSSARPPIGTAPAARAPDALQSEVEQLRVELSQTQQQLLQTQRRLEQVLQQLERDR